MNKIKRIQEIIEKLKKRNRLPKERQVYAVGTGTYVGEMLVYIKKQGDNYCFLSVPKNRNRTVPIEKFDFGLEHKIIEFVEELPKPIYKLCVAQHAFNEKHPVKQENTDNKLK